MIKYIEKDNPINNIIDIDLIIKRICYSLNISKETLLKKIKVDEIKTILNNLIANRNIDIEKSMNHIEKSITSPYDLINATEAANIITEYLNDKKSHIFIYSDYDCDGICASYIIYSVLKNLSKGHVNLYVPERIDGYGLNINYCNDIIEQYADVDGKKIVLTVDNGITKKDEVKLLKENNFEVIITDHHSSKEESLPNCLIVDPRNESNQQPEFEHLCGAGVAFKICEIIEHNFNMDDMLKYTPYLALATLGDVMPLTNENIALIDYGLEIINSEYCPEGLKELKTIKNMDIITANDIQWTIAPMINACGRLGNANLAYKLFELDEYVSTKEIVEKIDSINNNRKKITKKAKEEIEKMTFDDNICIYFNEKYPAGIVGIIAGKLTEKFEKPAFVVSLNEKGTYNGSVRSYGNLNILKHLEELKKRNLILNYGGHPFAGAVEFKKEQLNDIISYFNENLNIPKTEEKNDENIEIVLDNELKLSNLNKYYYALTNLFPYDDKSYLNPMFIIKNLKVKSFKLSNNNSSNINFSLKDDNNNSKDIWAWNFANKYLFELEAPETISLIGSITKGFDGKYTFNVADII